MDAFHAASKGEPHAGERASKDGRPELAGSRIAQRNGFTAARKANDASPIMIRPYIILLASALLV
jgi:hypothetical protein